jgi:hypothetical protein
MARPKKKSPTPPTSPTQPTGPSLAEVRRIYEKYKPLLLGCRGVTQVTYGVKHSGGKYGFEDDGGELKFAIIIHVKEKKRDMKPGSKGYIPDSIENIPTDIIPDPIARIHAHANGGQMQGGVGIELILPDSSSGGTGTLGVVVRDSNSNQLYALTCAHVAFGRPLNAPANSNIRLTAGGLVIGNPTRNGLLPAFGGRFDAGAIQLLSGLSPAPQRRVVMPHGQIPVVSMDDLTTVAVEQQGAMSAATVTGSIKRIGETAFVEYDPGTGTGRTLTDLIRVNADTPPFGVAGDSGSILVGSVNGDFVAIGLYIGTDPATGDGFAMKLVDVLNGLQLTF